MKIQGIGAITCRGRGIESVQAALEHGLQPPEFIDVPGYPEPFPVRQLKLDTLKDKEVLKGMRRADRLSKMATLAAFDAWQHAGTPDVSPEKVGIILATGLGPHARTFKFLDGILEFGDAAVSPTDFSHSVHNAAAGYIATRMGAHGPVQTVTDFDFAFPQALALAECWLNEKRCDAVLVGTAEELGDVMLHVCGRMLDIPADGTPPPYHFNEEPVVIPGEGAAFFVMTSADGPEGMANLQLRTADDPTGADPPPDLTILDAEGLSGDETAYTVKASAALCAANYSVLFGSMMTGMSIQCAAASLSIKNRTFYATPLADSAPSLPLCRKTGPDAVRKIECLKYGRDRRWQRIEIG